MPLRRDDFRSQWNAGLQRIRFSTSNCYYDYIYIVSELEDIVGKVYNLGSIV